MAEVINSQGQISPFAEDRIIGSLVRAGVEGKTAVQQAATLGAVVESSGISPVSTNGIRFGLGELAINPTHPDLSKITSFLKLDSVSGRPTSPAVPRTGLGIPGVEEFVSQYKVVRPHEPLNITLPGGMIQVENKAMAAIIPVARLVSEVGGKLFFTPVQIVEVDRQKTDETLGGLVEKLGVDVSGFEISVFSTQPSESLIQSSSRQAVELQVSLLRGNNKVASSRFPGELIVKATTERPIGDISDEDSWHLFDCHSHWYWGIWGRWTVCHGPCPPGGGTCRCEESGSQRCSGWTTCGCG